VSAKTEAIFAAITSHDIPTLRRCLKVGRELESTNEYGRTPLAQASLLGFADAVLEILQYRPQLETSDEDGNTALILAASFDRNDVVKHLLHAGADVNGRNRLTGGTALLVAPAAVSVSLCPDCVSVLLAAGADINLQNGAGITALMRAADNDRAECATALLKAGALIDLADSKGRTALFHAVRARSANVCEVLIQAGANVNFEDSRQDTPSMEAQRSGSDSIRHVFNKRHS